MKTAPSESGSASHTNSHPEPETESETRSETKAASGRESHSASAAGLNFEVLPPEVQQFRNAAREFAHDVVKPRVLPMDQAPAEDFDWQLVSQGHQIGLTRAAVPKDYGGMGVGMLGVATALEEVAAVCPGTALIFGATMLGQAPVLLSGDPRLQARFLPLFSGDEPVLACNAVTEEDAGCDLIIPSQAQYARNVMTARRAGDHYVLTGRKRFITNAKIAAFASVFANMEGSPGATGLTSFIVPLDLPGVVRGPVADKMGYRACLGSELEFHDVRVPAEYMIGGEGEGMAINMAQSNMARAAVAGISTGVARSALERATAWCGERVQGGRHLRHQQFTAAKLAGMAAKVDAARLLYLRAADKVDNELPPPAYEPAVAKLFADRTAIEVADAALSLIGARGYLRSYGVEKTMRDALGTRIYEGTPEVLALAITDGLYAQEDEW
ncbi:acyl-CoA dehydrogenase family protein [Streptomyces sp. NPDC046197]|uniref:acyl-CoA dehydrogenase family protein n=1 Tax=Streptomyces sp. NPDC046197 TaxID=3154337 RepID=UPI0033C74DD8